MEIDKMSSDDIREYLDDRDRLDEVAKRISLITQEETDLELIKNAPDHEKEIVYDHVRVGDPVSHIIHKSLSLDLKVVIVYTYLKHKKGTTTTGYASQEPELHSMKYAKKVNLKMKVKEDIQINKQEKK